MPNSRSVYNFVKLEIGKAPRDAGEAPGPRQRSYTPGFPPPIAPTPASAAPIWGAPYLAGRLGAGVVLSPRRAGVGMRQVAFAVHGRETRPPPQQHPRGAGANSPPSPSRATTLQSGNCFSEQLQGKCPLPIPILTRCQQPGDGVLSSGAGSSGGCGAEKQNATLSRSSEANDDKQHSRPPPNTMGALDSIPKETGEQDPGSTWLSDALRFRTPAWTSRRLRGARGAVRSAEWGRVRAAAGLRGPFLGAARSAET